MIIIISIVFLSGVYVGARWSDKFKELLNAITGK